MSLTDTFDGYEALNSVSNTTTYDEIKNLYDHWAKNYEQDINSHGYLGHNFCTDVFNGEMKKTFPDPDSRLKLRVMDAGAGTGIVGEHLQDIGYTNIDGLDISSEMLKIAEAKHIYRKLICAPISEKKVEEIETGYYDGIISSGTITIAHVKSASLGEIQRWLKPGK